MNGVSIKGVMSALNRMGLLEKADGRVPTAVDLYRDRRWQLRYKHLFAAKPSVVLYPLSPR
ncbi:hypothetical protein PQZ11_07125 [Luminiphilus sp.]|nr:hypothetical protein [Luminiphilus sp.]